MSLKAMLWALEEAPIDDPTALLVLVALAERSDENGRNAWPTRAWLAKRARISTRTVQRRLNILEEAGLISRGNQDVVGHLRADHRPTNWDLNFTATRGDKLSPREATGCHARSNGVTGQVERGDTVGTQTVHEPSLNQGEIERGDTAVTSLENTQSAGSAVAAESAGPIHQQVTRWAYDQLGGAFNFAAVMKIAKWAIETRGSTPNDVAKAIVSIHRSGRPVTKQIMDQTLPRPRANLAAQIGRMIDADDIAGVKKLTALTHIPDPPNLDEIEDMPATQRRAAKDAWRTQWLRENLQMLASRAEERQGVPAMAK
ncbi:helix-turn-helix DNA-binding domain protein [Gordonia phage DatBoi]|nr:helix-turn-helix DNA-binding domain protein [Gordonia phage DatBoi]